VRSFRGDINRAPKDWRGSLSESEKEKTLKAFEQLDLGKRLLHQPVMAEAWQRIIK
jgi:hypothetical protein